MNDVLVGLDIGTSNVRVVIAEYDENNSLKIIGIGQAPSTGLKNGVIVNIEATMQTVKDAISSAESMAGCLVSSVIVGIGGSQVESRNNKGSIPVFNKDRTEGEITVTDKNNVIKNALAVLIPMDRKIIHIIPRSYIVDDQKPIKDPINVMGIRLEAEVHIITVVKSSAINFEKCITRAGYGLKNLMSKTLAQSEVVTTKEERELGSILIDLGGGSTDVLVLLDDSPVYSTSIPLGGIIVTNDIARVRGISFDTAEKIKIENGCCWNLLVDDYEEVLIPGIGGRPPETVLRSQICEIIQPRMEEILEMVRDEIYNHTKFASLYGNIILTGGGANMPGILDLVGKVFDTNSVRIGYPSNYGNNTELYRKPEFATACGLIVATENSISSANINYMDEKHHASKNSNKKTIINSVKKFFKEIF